MTQRTIISTQKAPKPGGAYSQAVAAGDIIFCSGQIPIDPVSGSFSGTDAAGQARQCMENLAAVLEEAGSSLSNAVKMQIYLTDMADFSNVDRVYGSYFDDKPPARVCIQVAALPKGAKVEIEAVALKIK